MAHKFSIQGRQFFADITPDLTSGFEVKSTPRPYRVDLPIGRTPDETLAAEIARHSAPLLLVDRRIRELYFANNSALGSVVQFQIEARENVKQISTVLSVIEFLEKNGATKNSMLFVVGGGIVQDIGAFSGSLYKRGLPWTFVPTTLLAQGDSGVGGKTALNHDATKNLIALFSAPRRVIIDTGFLKTLDGDDLLSGMGEILRLCVTGGRGFLDEFIGFLPQFLAGEEFARRELIARSLAVKRAVVEFDEFELDIRRSMNYGHSFGHALEALSEFRIPHGIAVSIGILVENEISFRRGILPIRDRDEILSLCRQIIPAGSRRMFSSASLDGILDLLRKDKKAEGAVLKLATLERIGEMRFMDLPLDQSGRAEVEAAVSSVLKEL